MECIHNNIMLEILINNINYYILIPFKDKWDVLQ